MGPIEQLVMRAWGLGVRVTEQEAGTQGEQSRSLREVLEQARELDSTEIAHWRDRVTGKMMVGTPMAKASWMAAEEEYERAVSANAARVGGSRP